LSLTLICHVLSSDRHVPAFRERHAGERVGDSRMQLAAERLQSVRFKDHSKSQTDDAPPDRAVAPDRAGSRRPRAKGSFWCIGAGSCTCRRFWLVSWAKASIRLTRRRRVGQSQ
jgi:hypothetical protein